MASPGKRLTSNVAGEFYVDDTCIDCAACRWMAPQVFDAHGSTSRVYCQPRAPEDRTRALQAAVACPTGSIGCDDPAGVAWAAESFPHPIEDGVYHAGYHSEKSFGAASYLIVRPEGNVLVDSPRFNRRLMRRIEELGGVALMFLTHRDDVADHQRYHERFGCKRILHARDVTAGTRGVEVVIQGDEPVALDDRLCVIPTPGHTRGSACLLYDDRFLFSGDHVAFSTEDDAIIAFEDACWFDWRVQTRSMERLLAHRFEHLLPGHGDPCRFEPDEMHERMQQCVAWMRAR